MRSDLMLVTEIQPAPHAAAVGLVAADVRKPAINLLGALRVIAIRWHAVADVTIPMFVKSDGPAQRRYLTPALSGCQCVGV